MELKDYCAGLQCELTGWKAKVYDVVRKFDRLFNILSQNEWIRAAIGGYILFTLLLILGIGTYQSV